MIRNVLLLKQLAVAETIDSVAETVKYVAEIVSGHVNSVTTRDLRFQKSISGMMATRRRQARNVVTWIVLKPVFLYLL